MKYSTLVRVYEELSSTTKTLEKTRILAEFIPQIPASHMEQAVLLVSGRVYPEWNKQDLGIGTKLVMRAIASSSGSSTKDVENRWKKIGDLGEVSQELLGKKKQLTLFRKRLTVDKVVENLRKIAEMQGSGTVNRKIDLLKELLTHAEPVSAKYIVRTCLEDLRVGVGSGTIRDAVAKAFDIDKDIVQKAYDLTTDFAEVARLAKERGASGLKSTRIGTMKPIKVMLYQKVASAEEGFSRVGKPAAIEYKYDGFRMQVHKKADKIIIYTRRLENVTRQFPDIVKACNRALKAKSCIVEGETIGLDPKTGQWLPFQRISQRIKRKHNIEQMVRDVPVMINMFDIVYLDGKNLLTEPFSNRRKLLEKTVSPVKDKVQLATEIITSDVAEAERFFVKSQSRGNEGVMMKTLDAPYKPGSRVGYGVKLKPVTETLDLVIVGAEWGTGKRATWLSSFVLGCRDPATGNFLTIGKMGTGVKEKEEQGTSFKQLTKLLKPLILSEHGKSVKINPKIVLEVGYEEIQKSPTYESGFALRFPRLVRLRDDRAPEEADTIIRIKNLYKNQKK